ncbi:MAG TPA: gliding motility-associated C-terminal domain-containing protein [Flavobacteriales bacterium]
MPEHPPIDRLSHKAGSWIIGLLLWLLQSPVCAQIYPFNSGPIPLCDTSTFTANVFGIGILQPPGMGWWSYSLQNLGIAITSNHPQTLKITVTSPQGTTLLLSAFNGAGGQNYTNTNFTNGGWSPNITTGNAPFNGYWTGQGGDLSVFDYENADGTWTITVIDTACAGGGIGPGGPWTPGWFNGSAGNAGFAFAFDGPPPCWGSIPNGQSILCPGTTVDINSYYSSFGYTITVSLNGTPVDASAVTVPGWYDVIADDPWQGCTYWASYEVFAASPPLGPDHTVSRCSNGPGANLAYGLVFNTPPLWTFNGTPISGASAGTAFTAGVYRVIAQPNTACSDTTYVTLTVDPAPDLGPNTAVSICAGGSVDLTTVVNTAGSTTAWTFQSAPFATPTSATQPGNYSVTATSAAGCMDQANVNVTVGSGPALGADQAVLRCGNEPVDLTALYITTGLTTTWTLLGAPVADPTAVLVSGTYRLVASNGGSCADTAFVAVNDAGSPSLGNDTWALICSGDAYDLTTLFSAGGSTLEWWYNGAVIPSPTAASAPGSYTVVATNGGGCTDTAAVDLGIAPDPVVGEDQSITTCAGTAVDLTSVYPFPADALVWTQYGDAVADPTTVIGEGIYTAGYTSVDGCEASAAVTVSWQASPALGADQVFDVCSNTFLDLTSLYNTAGLTAAWTYIGAPVMDPSSVNGGGTYRLVASNSDDCADTALVVVNSLVAPSIGADTWATACVGEGDDLTSFYDNIPGITSAVWSFAGDPIDPPVAADVPGVYTLVAMNTQGCTDTALVNVDLAPEVLLGDDQSIVACEGQAVDLNAVFATGANTDTWTLQGVEVADPTAVTEAGTYSLTSMNAYGCSGTAQATLTLEPAPELGADQVVSTCAGVPVDLSALIGTNASWTLNGAAVSDPTAVLLPGAYRFVETNAAGCTDTLFVTMTVHAGPALGADRLFTLCAWESVDLTTEFPASGSDISYTLNGVPVADPTAVTEAGTYVITAVDANGCSDEAMAEVEIVACLCEADFTLEGHCIQEPVRVVVHTEQPVLDAHWSGSGSVSPMHQGDPLLWFTQAGVNEVTLELTLVCGVVQVQHSIELEDCAARCNVWAPSAFTPDGDGLNDTWSWSGACIPMDYFVSVHDRWGTVVFTSKDPTQRWDGTFKGEEVPTGVYAYRMGYRLPYQEPEEVSGAVTLVR